MLTGVRRRAAWALAVLAMTVASTTGTGHAAPSKVPKGATYVALGSSYGSGPGLRPIVDLGCLRSAADYPHQVAQRYRLHLIDATCSGATTANILTKPQRVLTSRRVPPQLRAVTSDTRLVTITIGGNDISYIGDLTVQSCHNLLQGAQPALLPTAHRLCRVPTAAPRHHRVNIATVQHALIDVVESVRSRAPKATVMLVDYLPVLDAQATTCAIAPLTHDEAVTLRRTYTDLLTATQHAADATGARLARVDDTSHTVCSAQPWVTGLELPNPAAGQGIPYHPTVAGMNAVADAVGKVLESK